ncbi:MAG: class I SAM-dependent methyltransferase [Flavobacteriaceae bacterium]|nr:class I SAM-dependent methyltransferase [Flavobacteriaceae bacterium]
MLYQIKQYLKFLKTSTNQHGVHSPFVFDLVTKCLYNKTIYPDYHKITSYKKQLKHSKQKLQITDLGAGSQKFKSNIRSVSDIAKHVSISTKHAKLLYRLTTYLKPNTILELGTSLGVATQALSLANPEAKITTIEGCPEISKFSKAQFDKRLLGNINVKTGDFSEVIPNLTPTTFDLIFFDGNHTKEATLTYFEMLLPKANNNSVFIFDDIHWSKGMAEAWNTIKNHPSVTVSIDTFFWGIIFFRKEQAKEHFVIRV